MARVFTALPSAARTASGTADIGGIPEQQPELLIYIDVTVFTGTTMTVTYQSSYDGTNFFDNTAGAAITAVGKQLIKVPNTSGSYGRLSYALTGTSFTFSVVVEAK